MIEIAGGILLAIGVLILLPFILFALSWIALALIAVGIVTLIVMYAPTSMPALYGMAAVVAVVGLSGSIIVVIVARLELPSPHPWSAWKKLRAWCWGALVMVLLAMSVAQGTTTARVAAYLLVALMCLGFANALFVVIRNMHPHARFFR